MKQRKYSTQTWNEHPLQPKTKDQSTLDWYIYIILNESMMVIKLTFVSPSYLGSFS